jgi:hypothetical protein
MVDSDSIALFRATPQERGAPVAEWIARGRSG